MKRTSLLLLLLLLGCKEEPAPSPQPTASTSTSPAASASSSGKPTIDPVAHVVVLEEIAAIHAKNLPCIETAANLLVNRQKMVKAMMETQEVSLANALEKDKALKARRDKALATIEAGEKRCQQDAGVK